MRLPALSLCSTMLRSLAAIVALGLLLVPVECSVAAGPHSIFLDAQDLAALQTANAGSPGRSGHHGHGHSERDTAGRAMPPLSGGITGQEHPVQQAPASLGHGHASSGDDAGTSLADTAPPSTAGFASDSIVAIVVAGVEHPMTAVGPLSLAVPDLLAPPDHALRAPEPPPP